MDDRQELEELQEELDRWEETTLQPSLKRMPERRDRFVTASSDPVTRLYTPLDIQDLDYKRDLGMPGAYPFTRG
ncbi:MAG: hypothetical protein WBD56_15060, partial [Anaerolineales bacterium]